MGEIGVNWGLTYVYFRDKINMEKRTDGPNAQDKGYRTMKTQRATETYYVKNSAESGAPTAVQTGGKRAAAKIFAGRNPLPEWTFEVWTEVEWRNGSSPSTYGVDDF